MKHNRINQYVKGERITTTKDGTNSSNNDKQLFYSYLDGILC
jgi:hypothetical protein